jgi:hypothetical protein
MPDILRKIPFAEALLVAVQDFDCASEEWETPLAAWIKAEPKVKNGALYQMKKRNGKLQVWLHVNQADGPTKPKFGNHIAICCVAIYTYVNYRVSRSGYKGFFQRHAAAFIVSYSQDGKTKRSSLLATHGRRKTRFGPCVVTSYGENESRTSD